MPAEKRIIEIPLTAEHLRAAVRAKCEHHYFVDAQIETGWNCINAYISEVFHKEAAS